MGHAGVYVSIIYGDGIVFCNERQELYDICRKLKDKGFVIVTVLGFGDLGVLIGSCIEEKILCGVSKQQQKQPQYFPDYS